MDKNKNTTAIQIPYELKALVRKYGQSLRKEPKYIVLGTFHSKNNPPFMGILAGASNEFHAHLIRREVHKSGGNCQIEQTEYHPDGPTFSLEDYRREAEKLRRKKAKEQD